MPNSEPVSPRTNGRHPDTGRRSLTEWLRAVTRDLFQGIGEQGFNETGGAGGWGDFQTSWGDDHASWGDYQASWGERGAGWYSGLAIMPGRAASPAEAAEFSGQMSRLYRALHAPAPGRADQKPQLVRRSAPDRELPSRPGNVPQVAPNPALLHANASQAGVRPAGMA